MAHSERSGPEELVIVIRDLPAGTRTDLPAVFASISDLFPGCSVEVSQGTAYAGPPERKLRNPAGPCLSVNCSC